MLAHYFKIAFRNLLKYRQQSIVSIIGLAMGFTCFALATLWIRYENALLKLLDFVSIVCIVISVFGIFSLVSLNCEQRQKEIAIRKVNGATANSIIRMFFKEYILLLCLAAIIALPAGYLIMKSWLQNYVIQTTISFWIYPLLFISLLAIITLCIYWRIWKAANSNPAEIIKSE